MHARANMALRASASAASAAQRAAAYSAAAAAAAARAADAAENAAAAASASQVLLCFAVPARFLPTVLQSQQLAPFHCLTFPAMAVSCASHMRMNSQGPPVVVF